MTAESGVFVVFDNITDTTVDEHDSTLVMSEFLLQEAIRTSVRIALS
jgi:hypothetical protein